MKLKHAISNVIILAVLFGQINMPLFIEICSKTHAVSFLSTCAMHKPVPHKHSCCGKNGSKGNASQLNNNDRTDANHCVVVFSKEHSTDGSITNITTVDAGLHIEGIIQMEQAQVFISSLLAYPFIDTSPTVSPPLFLLDSSFRI